MGMCTGTEYGKAKMSFVKVPQDVLGYTRLHPYSMPNVELPIITLTKPWSCTDVMLLLINLIGGKDINT